MGIVLINTVVSIWICVAVLILFVIVQTKNNSVDVVITAMFPVVAAIILGRYLQKRFSSYTLISYGISSVGVLIITLIVISLF